MKEKIKKFENLTVWQKAHELVLEVYRITKVFPREERFGIVSQMRRSAISVAANIVEGFKRRGVRDKLNFYNISQSSLNEVQYYAILAKDLRYTNNLVKIESYIEEIGKMLNGLISSIKRNPNT